MLVKRFVVMLTWPQVSDSVSHLYCCRGVVTALALLFGIVDDTGQGQHLEAVLQKSDAFARPSEFKQHVHRWCMNASRDVLMSTHTCVRTNIRKHRNIT